MLSYLNMPLMEARQETPHQWHARAIQQGTKQGSMFAVAIPFILISSIVMGLRIYVRLSLVQAGLGIDDRKLSRVEYEDFTS